MATKTKAKVVAKPIVGRSIAREEIDKTDGLTPRVQRIKQRYLEAQPHVSGERAWYMIESHKTTDGEHPAIRAAKWFRNVMEKMSIAIWDDELLVGANTQHIRGAHPRIESFPSSNLRRLKAETVTTASLANVAVISPEDREKLIAAGEYWEKYWQERVAKEPNILVQRTPEEIAQERARQACLIDFSFDVWEGKEGGSGESVPIANVGMTGIAPGADYAKIMKVGFNGIIAEAKDHIARIQSKSPGKRTLEDDDKLYNLEGMVMALEAMITFAHRHAVLAREMASKEKDPQRKKDLEKIAEVCDWIPGNPPRSFHEALQTHWFILIGQEIEKTMTNAYIGRFDQYMYPCYEKDINEGRLTRQEAAELMACMYMKWQQLEAFSLGDFHVVVPGSYLANVTVGGVTPRDGKDASNELSCLVLHVGKQVKTNQPHISLRWHRAMAPEFLDKAIECTRDHGGGIPAWFSDRHGIEYLLERGYSFEEARDWAILGCVNIAVCKFTSWCRRGPSAGFVNEPKLLELTLNNGIEPVTGVMLGIPTGDPRDFKTFDELLEAHRQQIRHYYKSTVNRTQDRYLRTIDTHAHIPFISSLLDGPVERGQDANHGGQRFEFEHLGGPIHTTDRGLTDVTDALMAIKKVVFEDKAATMDELLNALKADWEGYEDLRRKCQAAPKFGNDDDEADSLICDLWQYTLDLGKETYRDPCGRRGIQLRQGAGWAQWAGKKVGALPNGRQAWTNLADASASPVQGADRKGPTAVLNSVSKLDHTDLEGPLLNMKLTPRPLITKEGRQKFAQMLATYFDKGGYHVQFTVLDKETLLDAKAHPENYRNLVVRVAGYSAFWVELPENLQDEIISRSEHEI